MSVIAFLLVGDPHAQSRSSFTDDLAFLKQHTQIIVLSDGHGAQVAIAPAYQGRVMTSTTGGSDDPSFGWIGRAAITSGQRQPHINVFGGEDRFWIGPEGGQFSFYFKKGDPFDLDHWQVPEAIDWARWEPSRQGATFAFFKHTFTATNYSGNDFNIAVERDIRLLSPAEIAGEIGGPLPGEIRVVAYQSRNAVTNAGTTAWTEQTGMPSVWLLGMFNPSQQATIVAPYVSGPVSTLGPIVNDAYFGKVPSDRLAIRPQAILFKADGTYRSKIGLSPKRAGTTIGSYDAARHALTIVNFGRSYNAHMTRYVNSMWEIQKDPFSGDIANAYNDGPPAPGKPPLGPFYELESSSPALALAPGQSYIYGQKIIHLVGPDAALDPIARRVLHTSIAEIKAF